MLNTRPAFTPLIHTFGVMTTSLKVDLLVWFGSVLRDHSGDQGYKEGSVTCKTSTLTPVPSLKLHIMMRMRHRLSKQALIF